MTRLAHLRQLHQRALETKRTGTQTVDALMATDDLLALLLWNHDAALPHLLDIAEAASLYVNARDRQEQGHLAHLREALNRLEQP